MPVDKTRRRPRVSPAGSEWSTPRTRLVHRLSPGLSTGVEGWDTPLRKRPHTLPRTGIHLLEHALGLTRATPLPCTGGPDAAARGQLGDPPPSPRAGGRGGWLFPFDRGSPGVPPHDTRSPRRSPPGRAARSKPLGGRSEAGGSCKDDAPSPPHPDARSDRGTRRRTASERHRGPGSGRGGAEGVFRLNACGRARGRRCVRDRRSACSAAAADGQL